MLDWPTLCKLRVGSYVDLPEGGIALEDGVYKISDSKYFLADSVFEEGKERIKLGSLFWASSEPAFRRAYFREIESDDMAECFPPVELLPSEAGMSYGSIRGALRSLDPQHFLEYASYRVISDGAFVHKSLEGQRAIYYFRSPEIIESELPYAILLRS
ncbi:hypothetical protein [Pseudomonas fildesensis]|uniref:Uncharacterized protein n=1 Tax=Pseudomonas fildesensis TaxID=1674920 RepID=A0A0J8FVL6_9PSED|nr:hypothetical protein [Pseudomonas fildesensis]KMT52739.1 hypothetical protein ACR52_25865 [Pseudomonas fildesensis]